MPVKEKTAFEAELATERALVSDTNNIKRQPISADFQERKHMPIRSNFTAGAGPILGPGTYDGAPGSYPVNPDMQFPPASASPFRNEPKSGIGLLEAHASEI